MAERNHVWVRASNAVGEWLDSTPERIATRIAGNEPPWTRKLTEEESLRFWRDKLFNAEGVPNPDVTGKFLQDNGAHTYALLATRLRKKGLLSNDPEQLDEPAGLPAAPEPPAGSPPPGMLPAQAAPPPPLPEPVPVGGAY